MIDIIENVDNLIDNLSNTDFVKNMKEIKNKSNITDLDKKEYIKNQNILDMHIYYLNTEIKKITNNKVCR